MKITEEMVEQLAITPITPHSKGLVAGVDAVLALRSRNGCEQTIAREGMEFMEAYQNSIADDKPASTAQKEKDVAAEDEVVGLARDIWKRNGGLESVFNTLIKMPAHINKNGEGRKAVQKCIADARAMLEQKSKQSLAAQKLWNRLDTLEPETAELVRAVVQPILEGEMK